MTKLKAAEENPDGLEITSIGSLYAGSWDKKYWSSSRGKDRYPYPVGYQAVRAHNGNTYKMEIHEGSKGPLFLITSANGDSSSGQTPDITWDKFQKKYCPRIKIWHGKRFSCNIDGVEFFGFKNPFVQRLLRELVANVSGSAEQNLLSSGSCKEIPKADDVSYIPEASKSHDLLPYLERPKVTGRRSRRREIKNTKSSSNNDRKRSRSKELKYATEDSDPIKEDQSIHGIVSLGHSSKDDCDGCEQPAMLPQSLNLVHVQHKKGHLAEKETSSNSFDIPNQLRSNVSAEESRLLTASQCYESTGLAGNSATKEKPLDRLKSTEVEDFAFPIELEVKEREHTCPEDIQVLNDDVDLFAPDTLDIDQDCTSNYNPSTQDRINNKLQEEFISEDLIASKGSVTESYPEEEIGTSNSNAYSGKSDFDSVGQETAKSMMSFLLPQAIPLLSRTSRKKKAAAIPLEVLSSGIISKKKNKENNTASLGTVLLSDQRITDIKEHINVDSTDAMKFDVFDNVVDRIGGDHVPGVEVLSSADGNIDQITSNAETHFCNKCGQSVVIGHDDSLDCCLEAIGSKDICCYDKVHMDSSALLRHGEVSEEIMDATMSLVENSEDLVVCSHEKGLIVPDSIDFAAATESIDYDNLQLKESGMQTEAAKIGNIPFSQSPTLVYSRRKKVKTKSQMMGKYYGPLSESIICRKSGDGYVTDTCQTLSQLVASETPEMGSLNDNSHKKGLFGGRLEVLGKSKSSIADTPTMDSKTIQNNSVMVVKQDQSFTCSSKVIETAECLERLDSQVQKFTVHIDKEVVAHKNLLVANSSESSQKQEESLFNNSSVAEEFQYGSENFKPISTSIKKDFLGIFKPVGSYSHPLPVLSLIVSTGGTEIHICVVCGCLPVGKDGTLFMYKVATQEPTVGNPSFLGHTVITFPILKDYFGREIPVERSGLQFTPGGQSLVSLDSIKMPYCRQGRISCSCSTCASVSFEGDTVKIVKVNLGYVSVVAKLKTVESLQCVLVCEPNYLVAVGESGRLHLWVMNSAWSAHTDKFTMPSNDIISPGIVELKRIPKCNSLVVSHNGFGEFSLWDISKRIFLSKFSGLSSSVCDFIPIGLFGWQKYGHVSSDHDMDGHVNRMIAETCSWFSEQTSDRSVPPFHEDIAVWVLVSDAQHDIMSHNHQTKSSGSWRLALLAKNTVLLGSTLDPSVAAIGASSGHGIIGTSEGLVYVWEMTTGAQLGTLHHFKGKAVSCIVTDDSDKGAIAIAGGDGQLLVYLPLQ